jgi:hypothetical protein
MTAQIRQENRGNISMPNSAGLLARFNTAGYVVGLSAVVLIPCLWQPHVESSDLSGHMYNAWLALLVSQGKLPGLWIEGKWTNVLVDQLLSNSIRLFGAGTAEKIVPCLCALVFFWGAWYLIAALNKKPPLSIAILLLAFTYGVIFQWGFFNYYLSLGLCSFALAAASKRGSRGLLIAGILLIIGFYAQPLPVLWALSCAVYILVARTMRPRLRLILLAACIIGLIVIRHLLVSRFTGVWDVRQMIHAFGPDQLVAWTSKYTIVRDALLLYWVAMFVLLCRRDGVIRSALRIRVQLYALAVIAGITMPAVLHFPMYSGAYSAIPARLSLVAAILGCCVFASVPEKSWMRAVVVATALAYFALLYQDIHDINGIEEKVDRLVAQIPAGQRVISRLGYPPSYRIRVNPVPRACIGRCFVFSNYEVLSGQFRVRAEPGNSFSQWSDKESPEAQFFAASRDLPIYEIYSCGTDVCLRKLIAPSPLR